MTETVETEKKEYNKLYEQLVCVADDEYDEMAGMLAYGEYKREKNLFFSRYFKEHNKQPSKDHIDAFMLKYQDEETRNELLMLGRRKLYLFAEEYADGKRDEIMTEAKETEVVRTVRSNTAWWKGLVLSIGGALTYSIVIAGITFTITILQPDSPLSKFIKTLLQ